MAPVQNGVLQIDSEQNGFEKRILKSGLHGEAHGKTRKFTEIHGQGFLFKIRKFGYPYELINVVNFQLKNKRVDFLNRWINT